MISLAVMLDVLGLTSDGGAQDERVQRLIDQATAIVGRELGIYLGVPAAHEVIRRGGTALILLADEPVASEDVVVETRCRPTDTWVAAVEDSDYVQEGRALRSAYRWPAWVKVNFTRGYALDAGPAELIALVEGLVQMGWNAYANELTSGMQSETFGDYSYTRKDVTSQDGWQGIASRWRRGLI